MIIHYLKYISVFIMGLGIGCIIGRFFSRGGNKKHLDGEVENIATSISKGRECKLMYTELIKIVHPDKNPEKIELSKKYTGLLNRNRYNYAQLTILQQEVLNYF
jgi:hypothetical protein